MKQKYHLMSKNDSITFGADKENIWMSEVWMIWIIIEDLAHIWPSSICIDLQYVDNVEKLFAGGNIHWGITLIGSWIDKLLYVSKFVDANE